MRNLPSFGFIHAEPHEHLVHVRQGRVVSAAQGGSCFRWPGDAVALIDTRVRRLQFTADQVTREKVGVGVTGLAVFRVVGPLVAWRMLGTDESHVDILREMFVGATRRLVANLSLEDCLTRRKDALAAELMAEVGPVVAGSGHPEDDNPRGWGVAIDTIEIQDVRVLSKEVFERLQAPYREELALAALHARAELDRGEAEVRAASARAQEEVDRELARQREERLQEERARERAAALYALGVEREKVQARLQLEQERAEAGVTAARLQAEAARIVGEGQAEVERLRRATGDLSESRLRELLLTDTLPRLAEAFDGAVEKQVVIGGGEHPVARMVAELMGAIQGLRDPFAGPTR